MKEYVLGIISDTHYPENQLPIEEIKLHFKDVDLILHAGDLVSDKLLVLLKSIAPVEAVYGNMDPLDLRIKLPDKKILKFNEVSIGLAHGTGFYSKLKDKLSQYFKDEKIQIMVLGHTHRPCNQMIDNTLFFNPGSPVKPFFPNQPTIGIIRISPENHIQASIISVR